MADTTITCPEDLAELPDFDYDARRADLDNDAFPRLTSAYQHKPITHEQLQAAIDRLSTPRLSAKQAA